jgi:hypothetical protein
MMGIIYVIYIYGSAPGEIDLRRGDRRGGKVSGGIGGVGGYPLN